MVGRTVPELFGPELALSYLQQDELVLKSGRPMQNQLELIVRADGRLGWYVTSKAVIRSATGDAVGIAVLSVDLHSQVNSTHAGLAKVIRAVRESIHAQWRVADMAAVAGISTTSLERLARRTLGLPPQQLLQRLRLEHAVILITQTNLTLGSHLSGVRVLRPKLIHPAVSQGFGPHTWCLSPRGVSKPDNLVSCCYLIATCSLKSTPNG